jgi:hypothetical protein
VAAAKVEAVVVAVVVVKDFYLGCAKEMIRAWFLRNLKDDHWIVNFD